MAGNTADVVKEAYSILMKPYFKASVLFVSVQRNQEVWN